MSKCNVGKEDWRFLISWKKVWSMKFLKKIHPLTILSPGESLQGLGFV
jgi:hypothetical protein